MAKEDLTQENFVKLEQVIQKNKGTKGALIPVLHGAQEIFGYLSMEVQKKISEALNVPVAEIYGVVTFYSQFTLKPRGKYTIRVCLGTACYVKGSKSIIDKISRELNIEVGNTTNDGKYTFETTRCIGACGLGPVLTVNGDVYGKLVEADIPEILKKYE